MARNLLSFFAAGALALASAGAIQAADPADGGEARLRETLRSTMLQLRDAQTDLANLQAAQAAQGDQTKALNDQLTLLKKHAADDRATAEKAAEELKAKVAGQAQEIAQLQATLAQWRTAAEKTNAVARSIDGERVKLAVQNASLQRQVDDLELKNVTLFRLGNDILDRYEKFSLGEQFLAREPFIGRTRTALENQIQGYEDKMLALLVKP
jgi:chromosome segregation ATPase